MEVEGGCTGEYKDRLNYADVAANIWAHPYTGCFSFGCVLCVKLLEPKGPLTFFLMFLMQQKVDSSEYVALDQSSGVQ